MCVKIVKLKSSKEYDINTPLEEQLRGSQKVVINYIPYDPQIDKFVSEVERICKTGISCNLNIEVNTNNIVKGAKLKKEMKSLLVDVEINKLVKLMAMAQLTTDKRLEELADICRSR